MLMYGAGPRPDLFVHWGQLNNLWLRAVEARATQKSFLTTSLALFVVSLEWCDHRSSVQIIKVLHTRVVHSVFLVVINNEYSRSLTWIMWTRISNTVSRNWKPRSSFETKGTGNLSGGEQGNRLSGCGSALGWARPNEKVLRHACPVWNACMYVPRSLDTTYVSTE